MQTLWRCNDTPGPITTTQQQLVEWHLNTFVCEARRSEIERLFCFEPATVVC